MKKINLLLSIFMLFIFTACSTPNLFGKKVKKEYFNNGQIHSEFIMDDNTGQNGTLKKYGYDGKLISIVHIKHGVKDGIETGYDSKERVIFKYKYNNGRQDGLQKAFYPNGDIMILYTYKNGVKDGVARTYNKDGSINQEVMYKKGRIIN